MNRLLTLDDLCNFYSNHKNIVTYNADKHEGTPVVVQINGLMTFSEDDYDPELGLLKIHVRSSHIGDNRNRSTVSKKVMNQAKNSIYNRPILGFIHKLSDGTYDFAGHEMFVNDQDEMEYEEIPVGSIPESCNPEFVYDETEGKTYLEFDAYIYEEYTRAADIIREKKESKVSVEMCLLDYSYAPKEKKLVINKFYFSGVTVLGKDRYTEEPIEEGMKGSKLTLKDFKNNSFFSSIPEEEKNKLIDTLEKLNNTLSNFNKIQEEAPVENNGKEDNKQVENTDNVIIEETSTVEQEETPVVVESTEETPVIENNEEQTEETPEVVENERENTEKPVVEENSEEQPEVTEEEACKPKKKRCSVDKETGTLTYELSHDDVRYALYELLEPYCEADNEWYWISEVYDNRMVYEGFGGKIYEQKYSKDGDTVSFEGERTELFKELLTASEKAELESLRSNYSAIKSELNSYKEKELHAQREEVFADETYAGFMENEAFKVLKENMDTFSVDELRIKCELAFAKVVRENGSFGLSNKETVQTPAPAFFSFAKSEQETSFLDGLLKK